MDEFDSKGIRRQLKEALLSCDVSDPAAVAKLSQGNERKRMINNAELSLIFSASSCDTKKKSQN